MSHDENRRRFLHATMTGAGLLIVGATASAVEPEPQTKNEESPEDVSPAED